MSLLDDVLACPAFGLIRFGAADTVTLLGGARQDHQRLADVPLETDRPGDGTSADGGRFDRLLCVPYRQIHERGFEAHDDDTPLSSIQVSLTGEVELAELITHLPDEPVGTVSQCGFDIDDDAYAEVVEHVIRDEIGNGEGANLVIARTYQAQIDDWDTAKALTVFGRLLERERGAYWTFVVFTGDRYLIGASPERHISMHGGSVTMNPISGTFRVGGIDEPAERRDRLLDFLRDEKEIYELFMVVDEELKMMCSICSEGGQILGPYLKAMTHLIHTEYVLTGRTTKDVRSVLRDSMFAATVTGSPVENACRLIKKYEPVGRGYYGGVLALLGRDSAGAVTADAPILLRTADVSAAGGLRVSAGATLVRDSSPPYEVAETHAKAGGILTAFGLVPAPLAPPAEIEELTRDKEVLTSLRARNRRLSQFWFNDQSRTHGDSALAGKHVLVLDGEDEFVAMLRHVFHVLGMTSEAVRHQDYATGVFDDSDVVVVGPGPGDPRNLDDPKIKAVRAAIDDLLAGDTPFLAVCLGHQVLCAALGMSLHVKDIVFQGTQTEVEVLGRKESVGFYNTFVARVDGANETVASGTGRVGPGVRVEREASGDVHLVAGPRFRGIQFHAESILTENGIDLIRELVASIVSE
ncbi:MAG: chorismate-binding protein [Nocardioidaceae bacterium]|nr:chorismate-binding protein [Nocardioidaceae bacterium]